MRTIILAVLLTMMAATLQAADFELGLGAYERGDYASAQTSFSAAAQAGDSDAQFMLGRMYSRGQGVLQDYTQAYMWYNLAAAQGQRFAGPVRDALAERMTRPQIAKAQQMARDWQPRRVAPTRVDETDVIVNDQDISETILARVQLNLKRLGYAVDAISGRMDAQTQAAIMAYQADHQLPTDGFPSEQLLNHVLGQLGNRQPAIRKGPPAPPPVPQPSQNWRRLL